MSKLHARGSRVKAWAVSASRAGGRVLHAIGSDGRAVCRRAQTLQVVGVFSSVERVCSCLRRRGVIRALYDLASRAASDAPKQSETRPAVDDAGAGGELERRPHDSSVKQASPEKELAIAAAKRAETIRNNRPDRHRAYSDMYTGAHAQSRVVQCESCGENTEWRALPDMVRIGWTFRIAGRPPRLRWRCPEHTRTAHVNGHSVDGSSSEVRK